MNKIISKLGASLVIGATVLTSLVSVEAWGSSSNCCCDWWKIDGCWELGAAALYQQHCVQNFVFATDQVTSIFVFTGNTYSVRPKFYWGFRVWGGWYSCDGCEFFNLTWKHLWSNKDQRTVSGALSIPNVNLIGDPVVTQAQGRQRLQYDTVYLRGGRNLFCGCGSRFFAYGGLRYVGAEIRREARGATAIIGVKRTERTKFNGGGVELGVGGEHAIGCGFNLVGTFGAIALFGRRNDTRSAFGLVMVDETGTFARTLITYPDHNITKCVPGIDFRAAINYTYDWCGCGCNLRLVFELGWEMDYYWNILALGNSRAQDPTVTAVTFDRISPVNFGTNGPYGSLTLRF